MKTLKLLLLLIWLPLIGFSQNIFPSFKDKPTWNLDYWEMSASDETSVLRLVKDSLIHGKLYNMTDSFYYSHERAFYRVDSNKVYALNPLDSFREFLLYDFSVKQGDSLKLFFDVRFKQVKVIYRCKQIDTILEYGHSFKKYTFDMIDSIWHQPYNANYLQVIWYEGIGDAWHPFYCFSPTYPANEWGSYFMCFDTNSSLVFMRPGLTSCITGENTQKYSKAGIKISPNPFSFGFNLSIENIESSDASVRIYDLTGRERFNKLYKNIIGSLHENIIPDISSGMYVLKIQIGETIYSQKLIRQ